MQVNGLESGLLLSRHAIWSAAVRSEGRTVLEVTGQRSNTCLPVIKTEASCCTVLWHHLAPAHKSLEPLRKISLGSQECPSL